MATLTPNLNLRRPDETDHVDVTLDIAENMDKIDTAFGTIAVAIYISDTPPSSPGVNLVWIDTAGG
jgi:hypothetical protein